MAELLEFVKTVGLPGAIAFFVLWRVDMRLAELVREIKGLSSLLSTRLETLEHRLEEHERASTATPSTASLR